MTLILVSASPRRRELLGLLGLPFEVQAAGIDETPGDGESAEVYVRRVAREKAAAIINLQSSIMKLRTEDWRLVIAADTEVAIDGEILGKPGDADEARAMLTKLCGRTHEVLSAIVVVDPQSGAKVEALCRSDVPMREYSEAELAAYVESGDPFDKAGGYAIQHEAFHPVENFTHCYASVMGLPLCHLTRALRAFGVEPGADVPAACQRFNNYQCSVYRGILNGD
jgi:MAF protein